MSGTTDSSFQRVDQSELGFNGVDVALTTSGSGNSCGSKSFFNLGLNVGDDPLLVQARRLQVANWMGAPVCWLDQVHGSECIRVDQLAQAFQIHSCDATVTARSDTALAVLTADCLPVVFFAEGQAKAIGVAHAGWKGLAGGILENTAKAVANLVGVDTRSVHAWMGPAIGQQSFEVGQEVRQKFIELNEACVDCFKPAGTHGKYMADLYGLASVRLGLLGIRPTGGGKDTFTDPHYFSHRGFQKQPDQPAGRFATLARLLPSL